MFTTTATQQFTSRDWTLAKNASYTLRDRVDVGEKAVIRVDTVWNGPIERGTVAVVESYMNAGFRGIEAVLRLQNGRRVVVSAGLIVPTYAW